MISESFLIYLQTL